MQEAEVGPPSVMSELPSTASDAGSGEVGSGVLVGSESSHAKSTEAVEEGESPPDPSADVSLAAELAQLVREQSRSQSRLTRAGDVLLDGQAMDLEQWRALFNVIVADGQCQDIRVLRTSSGVAYLYSSQHISDSYARILLRLEEDDHYQLIAATVREESQTYPRPTALEVFTLHPFNLDTDRLMQLVGEMAQLEQYSDVKSTRASNGACYLYSDKSLDGEWARSMAEWYEVGINNSP